jgi:hypothetical protein
MAIGLYSEVALYASQKKKGSAMKPKKPIGEEIEDLLIKRGYRDWAFAITGVGKPAVNLWTAGSGLPEDILSDRRRQGDIHFELSILAAKIVAFQDASARIPTIPKKEVIPS